MTARHFLLFFALAFISLLSAAQAHANQIVHQFVNPNFGGNPNNAGFLLGQASANNRHKENTSKNELSPAQNIANQISDTVLAQIARNISSQIYGEDAVSSGSYDLGGANINFHTEGNTIVLNVSDGKGGFTTVRIPKPTL